MSTVSRDVTLGELAAHQPEAIEVLERFGLDYCCGGRRSLAAACEGRGVDVDAVQAALASLRPTAGVRWAEAPLPALIDHLLNAFHTPHRESFEALERMGDKVVSVHGDAPEWGARLRRLRALLAELVAELEVHMQKEERILFPWIVSGRGSSAGGPIQVMLADHDGAARLLEALRLEALDYTPPVGACATFRGFLGGLERLERELHAHMHLENNVLFPRALAG